MTGPLATVVCCLQTAWLLTADNESDASSATTCRRGFMGGRGVRRTRFGACACARHTSHTRARTRPRFDAWARSAQSSQANPFSRARTRPNIGAWQRSAESPQAKPFLRWSRHVRSLLTQTTPIGIILGMTTMTYTTPQAVSPFVLISPRPSLAIRIFGVAARITRKS